ncbi:MAG: class I SAM-dependent methyltransferase [Deltaproteobacteria bacterium]|jgi:SAM-dependent methyltransferase|nr:class I SAM-dependent methyltransferase [Deltaproteobacteria bacterium]
MIKRESIGRESIQSNNNQDVIWQHFQAYYPESFEGAKPRLNYIIREISSKKKSSVPRVLNIGAGDGYFEITSKRLLWDIFTLDPDGATINRLLGKRIKAYKGYIEQMPFDDSSFDFVVASEVLEHLDEEQRYKGLKEVVRVLDKNGWLIGTVPFFEKLHLNYVLCPKCGEYFHRWGHKKSFKINAIKSELFPFFSNINVKKTAFVNFQGSNLWGIIEGLIRLILAKYGARISSTNIYFIARK